MSQVKRKAKKSLNSSISDISNSEKLRDSIFNNDALSDIKNIHVADVIRSCRKQNIVNSTKKTRTATKPPTESKENKLYNYSAMTKIIDDKNITIESQSHQVQNLKIALEKVTKELDLNRIQYEKKKLQDLTMLRHQERENEENLKELTILKQGIKQMKSKLECMEIQNVKLHRKNNDYLIENEELTVKITSLKQEYLNQSVDEKVLNNLKQELHVLKEQGKMTKQLQNQKIHLEERCRNFQKKTNEYIVKYNDIQSEYNQSQIKYYRAQKENDDLKLTIHDLQIENKNLKKMMEEQKNIMIEQTQKWNSRLSRLEDKSRVQRCVSEYMEAKTAFNDFGERCRKLEDEDILEERLNEKEQKIQQLVSQKEELLKSLQQKQRVYYQLQEQQEITKSEQQHFQQVFSKKSTYIRELEQKSHQLIVQNQQINQRFAKHLKENSLAVQQYKSEINGLKQQIITLNESLLKKEAMIGEKESEQSLHQSWKIKIQQEVSSLHSEIERLEMEVQRLNEQLFSKQNESEETSQKFEDESKEKQKLFNIILEERQLKSELSTKLERQKQQKKAIEENLRFSQEEKIKYQGKIGQTNSELKQIKQLVSTYKEQIKQLNNQLEEAERNLQNEIYLKREESLKFEEQVSYFRGKYEQIFAQNVEISDKLCHLQKQNMAFQSENTKIARHRNDLEKENQIKMEEYQKKIKILTEEIKGLQQKVNDSQKIRQGINIRLQESQANRRNLESSVYRLKEEIREQIIRHDVQIKQIEKRYENTQQSQRKSEQSIVREHQERQMVWQQKYSAALNEAMEKDKLIHKNYELLENKDRQIEQLNCMVRNVENEEFEKLKNYNVRLTQQIDDVTAQFNKTYQELDFTRQENSKLRSSLQCIKNQVYDLRQKNTQMATQISTTQRNSQKEYDQYFYENNQLKIKVANLEQKLQEQIQESSEWMNRFEQVSKECRKIQSECNRVNRSYMDQSQRKSKENHREVENYRAEIRVLQQQNAQLQSVMDRELGKRKVMIEELIQEKKVLYEQLNRH